MVPQDGTHQKADWQQVANKPKPLELEQHCQTECHRGFFLKALQRFKREAPVWLAWHKGWCLRLSARWLQNTLKGRSTLNRPLKRVFVQVFSSHLVIKVSALSPSRLCTLKMLCFLVNSCGCWIDLDVFPKLIMLFSICTNWINTLKSEKSQ